MGIGEVVMALVKSVAVMDEGMGMMLEDGGVMVVLLGDEGEVDVVG